jgi:cytochrome c-type biogenesis protein CcmE
MGKVRVMAAKKHIIIITLGIVLVLFGGVFAWLSQVVEYVPSDVQADKVAYHQPVQLSGRVAEGSLRYLSQDGAYQFILQDEQATLSVQFPNALPRDFHEGKVVLLEGQLLDESHFAAERIRVRAPEVKSAV